MLQLPLPPLAESTWIEVEVQKGGLVCVYRGRVADSDARRILAGDRVGTAPLFDAYWSYDDGTGEELWVILGVTAGPYAHAGPLLLPLDRLITVIVLADGRERDSARLRAVAGDGRLQ